MVGTNLIDLPKSTYRCIAGEGRVRHRNRRSRSNIHRTTLLTPTRRTIKDKKGMIKINLKCQEDVGIDSTWALCRCSYPRGVQIKCGHKCACEDWFIHVREGEHVRVCIYIYICVYVFMCACKCAGVRVCGCAGERRHSWWWRSHESACLRSVMVTERWHHWWWR